MTPNTTSFADLLRSAVTDPGVVSSTYRQFHPTPERSARRILKAADQFLRAGRTDAEVQS
jgi:hypothetical protein